MDMHQQQQDEEMHEIPECHREKSRFADPHSASRTQDQIHAFRHNKNQENMNASASVGQPRAAIVHKPQPLPLRSNVLASGKTNLNNSIKLLFDREHEALLQWQKKDFHAFTKEVQESLGRTLRKHIRDYGIAIDRLQRQSASRSIVDKSDAPAMTSSVPPIPLKLEKFPDGEGRLHKVRQKHCWNHSTGDGNGRIRDTVEVTGNRSRTPFMDSDQPVMQNVAKEGHQNGMMDTETAGAILKGLKFHDDRNCVQKIPEDKIGNALDAFVKARDAVVNVREVAQRIDEHRSWMQLELNLTRLELMNLRFCRNHGSRAVLREAVELTAVVRSFILEICSALDCNELGVPWPFPRKADCSDVTPLFIKHLIDTLPVSSSS
ncbi:hypothetical protein KP509_01G093600 [Ceratopteris richardii]|uniref:Uncharacterized protein n=1 Tax=Ceratopteris richardii TaxID=49495 RepID=A0A8T2VN42_CERRI|nr:hypothetical protein KP509_01G093600 [Ceratopteris richardii]